MKPSHLTTPRTMNECVWTPGYGSAQPRMSAADKAVMWASLVAFIAVVLVVAFVPPMK